MSDHFSKISLEEPDLASIERSAVLLSQKLESEITSQSLREEQDLGDSFDAMMHAAGRAIVVAEIDGRVADANTAAEKQFGLERQQFVQLDINDLIPAADADFVDTLRKGLLRSDGIRLEADCLRHDATCFPVEISVTLLHLNGVEYFLLIIRDETHSRETRAQLEEAHRRIARAERLETSGTVAGQIAHDFNNLLSPLLAYPFLIRKDLPEDSTGRQYLDVMDKTVNDMAHMTDQLLALSRRGQFEQRVFNLNDLVTHVLTLIETRLEGIRVETDLAEDLMDIRGAHGQLVRVLQNLCVNAADAMGDHGTLHLSAQNVYLDDPVGSYDTVEVGEYVKVTVQDSGEGIPAAIADKIFDPFFTTKKSSKARGSGLGLSVVHGIIKDHDGYIDLESQEDVGTTFNIYIPIHREERGTEVGIPEKRETILVVDDDRSQVDLMVGLLSKLGFTATGLTDGTEAVAAYTELAEEDRPHLIIVDLVMSPGIGGLEVAERIKDIEPEQSFLAVSGHADMRDNPALKEAGIDYFLPKPFTFQVLSRVVNAALGQTSEVDVSPLGQARSTSEETDDIRTPEESIQEKAVAPARRIMIVDDEETIRKLFEVILSSELDNVSIDIACNGAEAVDTFTQKRHDVILMDLHMPVLDGKAAFTRIEKMCNEHDWTHPAVVFCTGFAPPDSVKSLISGSNRHGLLQKPVSGAVLVDEIRKRLTDS